jgi:outer membrane protein assembly factor BamE (lipoprotein component of BamABCDE complex)
MTSASSLNKYQGQPLTIVEMQNLLPVGMTQQEVVAIMGPPNHEVPSMNSWVYMKKST